MEDFSSGHWQHILLLNGEKRKLRRVKNDRKNGEGNCFYKLDAGKIKRTS